MKSPVGLQGIVDHKFRSRKIDHKGANSGHYWMVMMMSAKKKKITMMIKIIRKMY